MVEASAVFVHFTPSAADIQTIQAHKARNGQPRWLRHIVKPLMALYAAFSVGNLFSAIAAHATRESAIGHRVLPAFLGWALFGVVLGVAKWVSARNAFPTFDATHHVELRFDDHGVTLAAPAQRVVAWKHVTSVEDIGDAFVIGGAHHSLMAIPKRALTDGGTELWKLFDCQLIGRRGLRRPPRPTRLLMNSRSR